MQYIQIFICRKYTYCLCLKQRILCITYPESVLSKFGASGCAPAVFFPTKNAPSIFLNRESPFLCFKYIEHVLSQLGASGCAPARALFPSRIHLLYFINIESLFCRPIRHPSSSGRGASAAVARGASVGSKELCQNRENPYRQAVWGMSISVI